MEIPLLRQPFPWPLLPAPNRNFKQLCHQLILKANCSSFLLSFVLYYVSFTKLELLKARRAWGEKEERERGEKKKRRERKSIGEQDRLSIRVAELQFLPCQDEVWPILHKASHFKHTNTAQTDESCHVPLPHYCHLPAA